MKHSEQTKKILSMKRKKWLIDNPDKHPWKSKEKFISKPCEFFKNKLSEYGILFIEEFSPLKDRAYSIDVAIVDKLIGFEINGNQHYNSDKTLKEYYKKRKNEIENEGWLIYDIHYTKVYNDDFIKEIIEFIINNEVVNFNLDFNIVIKNFCEDCNCEILKRSKKCIKCHNISRRTDKYEKNIKYKIGNNKKEKVINYCKCGKKISSVSKNCKDCFGKNQRIVKERPTYEILLKEINDFGYEGTGRKYGISGNGIKKWLKV